MRARRVHLANAGMKKYEDYWDGVSMDYLLSLGPNKAFKESLENHLGDICLVVGIAGDAQLLSLYSENIVGINVSIEELKKARLVAHKPIDTILCDGGKLPFRGCQFDTIVCKSTLHHMVLCNAISDMYGVLKSKGLLLLYEPGLLNPIAMLGRLLFRSSIHVDTEKPFIWSNLRMHLNRFGALQSFERFLLFSHILPILAKYLKFLRKKLLLHSAYELDRLFCKTHLAELAWIGVFCARK